MHRRGCERWIEREELVSDDLERYDAGWLHFRKATITANYEPRTGTTSISLREPQPYWPLGCHYLSTTTRDLSWPPKTLLATMESG